MADEYQKPTHGYNSNESENQGEIKDRGMFDFLSKKKESSEEECKPVEEQHHDYKPEHHHATKLDHCEEVKPQPYHTKVDDYEEVKPAEHHNHKFGHHDEERKPEVEKLTNEVEHVYISEPPCEVEKNKPCEEEEEEKKPSLFEKLHRSHSNSSSSSSSDEEEEVMEDGVLVKRKKKFLKDKLKEKLHKKEEEKKEHCEDTSVPIEKCDEPVVHHHDTVHAVHEGEKKGLLDKLKEKLPGKKCEEEEQKKAGCAPIAPVHASTYDHEVVHSIHEGEEKKGFMEKLKEKLPAKKCEEEKASVEPVHVSSYESHPEPHHEVKEEKKGFLEKIKEKFSKNDDECKEKEKEKEIPAASHY